MLLCSNLEQLIGTAELEQQVADAAAQIEECEGEASQHVSNIQRFVYVASPSRPCIFCAADSWKAGDSSRQFQCTLLSAGWRPRG